MKGRVNIEGSQSELVAVRVQHESYIEEHPGVANRNPSESRLSRDQSVIKLVCIEKLISVQVSRT